MFGAGDGALDLDAAEQNLLAVLPHRLVADAGGADAHARRLTDDGSSREWAPTPAALGSRQ